MINIIVTAVVCVISATGIALMIKDALRKETPEEIARRNAFTGPSKFDWE